MTSKLEDVARAMLAEHMSQQSDGDCFDGVEGWPGPDATGSEALCRDYFLSLARAGLRATKRPTEKMMFAGGDAEENTELEKPRAFRARIVFEAMIDAALGEK